MREHKAMRGRTSGETDRQRDSMHIYVWESIKSRRAECCIRVRRANELCRETETDTKVEEERGAPRGPPTPPPPNQSESKYKYK